VIVNTPNNQTGRSYPPGTLSALADLLTAASRQCGRPIWLICDEPYARLVFSDAQFHSPSEFYPYIVISYSYVIDRALPVFRAAFDEAGPLTRR
jgi:aspartate aminotransferase